MLVYNLFFGLMTVILDIDSRPQDDEDDHDDSDSSDSFEQGYVLKSKT